MKWKVLASEYLHNKPWLTIRKDSCKLPNGKMVPEFYVNEYPDWVNVFGVTEEGKILMVQQYRHGLGEVGIELPGGVAEEGETPEAAAKREVLEETGYAFEKFDYLGKISANPSTTNNLMHMFVAEGGKKVADQKLDETEDLEVLHMTVDEVKELLKQNKMMQSLHAANIFYALHHLGHLNY